MEKPVVRRWGDDQTAVGDGLFQELGRTDWMQAIAFVGQDERRDMDAAIRLRVVTRGGDESPDSVP